MRIVIPLVALSVAAVAATPETSKLFDRFTDPVSGVVSYTLKDDLLGWHSQGLYYTTKSMTDDGRFLLFHFSDDERKNPNSAKALAFIDFEKDEAHVLPGIDGQIPFFDTVTAKLYYMPTGGEVRICMRDFRKDPFRDVELCKVPSEVWAPAEKPANLFTHLSMNAERTKVFFDIRGGTPAKRADLAPQVCRNGIFDLTTGKWEKWCDCKYCMNHGLLNPVDPTLAFAAHESCWTGMKPGDVYDRIHLFRADGSDVTIPPLNCNYATHEVWTDDGKGLIFCPNGVARYDVATGRQEMVCPIYGIHGTMDPEEKYVVFDSEVDVWWRGCPWKVSFWNRKSGRKIDIYTKSAAICPGSGNSKLLTLPGTKSCNLHPDAHPAFVCRGKYTVCTYNKPFRMALMITPVKQLIEKTSAPDGVCDREVWDLSETTVRIDRFEGDHDSPANQRAVKKLGAFLEARSGNRPKGSGRYFNIGWPPPDAAVAVPGEGYVEIRGGKAFLWGDPEKAVDVFIANCPPGVKVTLRDGTFWSSVNPAMTDVKGYSPAEVGGRLAQRFLCSDPEGYYEKGSVHYSVVSLWVNALEFARKTGNRELERALIEKFAPFYPGGARNNICAKARHVDHAVFGSLPLEVYLLTGDERAKTMGLAYADDQWAPPRADDLDNFPAHIRSHFVPLEKQRDFIARGYSGQTRLWIDDMYMINVLQSQAYLATGDRRYIDRAAHEMVLYLDTLQLPSGLFNHAEGIPFRWSRGNGWMAAGMPMILRHLPYGDPNRRRILAGYRRMMAALLEHQRADGLWTQLVDDADTWAETSGSAMFAFGFLEGVRNGWLPSDKYLAPALKAYRALVDRLDANGDISDVCIGTNAKNDRDWYLNRRRLVGDPHGQAPLLWVVNSLLSWPAKPSCDLKLSLLPGERWWGGQDAEGSKMPYTAASVYSADLRTWHAGNQAAPLLLSDKGRYVWCEEPFAFSFKDGVLKVETDGTAKIEHGKVGETLRDAYRYCSREFFPPSGKMPDALFISAPQYNTWIELTYNQNEADILRYAESMLANGLPPGVLMIDDTWQTGYGQWRFEPTRFKNPKALCKKLHELGFKVMFWVCPFVSMDTPEYRSLEKEGGFLVQRKPGRDAPPAGDPVPVRWWNGKSAVLDLTHPNGIKWFHNELSRLCDEFGVDGFKLDAGDPEYYVGDYKSYNYCTASGQCEAYAKIGLGFPFNEYRACWKMAGQPLVQRLRDKDHAWYEVPRLITDMVAAGLLGHSFVCPDMIGGGQFTSFLPGSDFDPELFVRSAQVHALSPMMQFSASPWRVLDKDGQEIIRKTVAMRQKFASRFVNLAEKCAKSGEPMLRSMEYEFPGNGFGDVADQFVMGDFLIVAPQLRKGAVSREVVLPPGKWHDDEGREHIGPCRISAVTPLSRIPYFERVK